VLLLSCLESSKGGLPKIDRRNSILTLRKVFKALLYKKGLRIFDSADDQAGVGSFLNQKFVSFTLILNQVVFAEKENEEFRVPLISYQ